MNIINNKTVWIEVICGSMFSGKTEELIRVSVENMPGSAIVFKPVIDTRYDENNIVSHSRMQAPSVPINQISEVYDHLEEDVQIVAIDEAQFFGEEVDSVDLQRPGR